MIPTEQMTPADIVPAYWKDMGSNDFAHAARWLTEDVRIRWPQSDEVILGRADFAAFNTAYPAAGWWSFTVNRIVGGDGEAASDVTVTDGAVTARAVTFHRISGGLISEQVEYWPDPFAVPGRRARRAGPNARALRPDAAKASVPFAAARRPW